MYRGSIIRQQTADSRQQTFMIILIKLKQWKDLLKNLLVYICHCDR